MSTVILNMSISLDGFVAGTDVGPEAPMDVHGEPAFASVTAADLELVGHRVLDGRVLLVEYRSTGKDIPRARTPEIGQSHSKAAEEERTHGHRCRTHHRRTSAARVLSRGLRDHRRTGMGRPADGDRNEMPGHDTVV